VKLHGHVIVRPTGIAAGSDQRRGSDKVKVMYRNTALREILVKLHLNTDGVGVPSCVRRPAECSCIPAYCSCSPAVYLKSVPALLQCSYMLFLQSVPAAMQCS
jgi:hypothetical protein